MSRLWPSQSHLSTATRTLFLGFIFAQSAGDFVHCSTPIDKGGLTMPILRPLSIISAVGTAKSAKVAGSSLARAQSRTDTVLCQCNLAPERQSRSSNPTLCLPPSWLSDGGAALAPVSLLRRRLHPPPIAARRSSLIGRPWRRRRRGNT